MMEARTRPFFSVFRAEVLKGRRGAPRKVALIAPLPFCALGVLSSGVISGTGATGGVATYLWNFWYVLMMPVAIAVLVCSTALGAMGVDAPGFAEGLAAATILTVASSWMVPAALALTVRFGTLAGIAIPVLLQLGAGIALYSSAAWFAFPPATTLCAVSPLLGVAPSGVPLEAGEALGAFGWEAVVGIVVAAVLFAVLAWAGATWFSKREAA